MTSLAPGTLMVVRHPTWLGGVSVEGQVLQQAGSVVVVLGPAMPVRRTALHEAYRVLTCNAEVGWLYADEMAPVDEENSG